MIGYIKFCLDTVDLYSSVMPAEIDGERAYILRSF